jgi:hypothetical protein
MMKLFRALLFGGGISRFDSKVILTFPAILNEVRNRTLKLLYRGSRDSFRSSNFHEKCDGENHAITFIRTAKSVFFGGYIPLSSDRTSGWKTDSNHHSFVFTITNPRKIGSRKFALKPDHLQYAIHYSTLYDRILSDGHTIYVCVTVPHLIAAIQNSVAPSITLDWMIALSSWANETS